MIIAALIQYRHSDHYGTTKVAPPNDHLHTKRTLQQIHQKFGGGGHGPRGCSTVTPTNYVSTLFSEFPNFVFHKKYFIHNYV